jgi:Arm DNA-binding domain
MQLVCPFMPKINKSFVDKVAKPQKGQIFYRDDELPGFGLRVTQGSKTYVAEGWVKCRNESCRVTIGKHGMITPEQARVEAKKILSEIARGINPNDSKSEMRVKAQTLAGVWEDYKSSRALRPKTLEVYESALRRCLADWMEKPITSITKDMVERRFNRMRSANGPRGEGKAQAHQTMRILRSLLNFAAGKYEDSTGKSILPENPVRRLSQAQLWQAAKPVRRTNLIQKGQLKSWFEAALSLENKTMSDYLVFCILTGLRRMEAGALTWKDVDLDSGMLTNQRRQNKEPR